ncbi:LysE family translocator [Nocardia sp. 2YAB30]|uniref:LysE family translocator n=1 Tax=Nocardia sp. 2YAB30 TaxID=3233022 RepID=UPI003F9EAD03
MLLQFLAASSVLAALTVVPGPDMAVVTKQAVGSSWQDGLRAVGGITVGLLIWGLLTVVGLVAIVAASVTVYTVVKLAGAAYLVFLGFQALLHSRRDPVALVAAPPAGNPWRTGLVSNLVNPKIAVFYTGLLPTLAPSGLPPHIGMTLLVLVHAILTLGWLGGYAMLLANARAFFERPSVRRSMDRVTGLVLIGFGVKVAASQP